MFRARWSFELKINKTLTYSLRMSEIFCELPILSMSTYNESDYFSFSAHNFLIPFCNVPLEKQQFTDQKFVSQHGVLFLFILFLR